MRCHPENDSGISRHISTLGWSDTPDTKAANTSNMRAAATLRAREPGLKYVRTGERTAMVGSLEFDKAENCCMTKL